MVIIVIAISGLFMYAVHKLNDDNLVDSLTPHLNDVAKSNAVYSAIISVLVKPSN